MAALVAAARRASSIANALTRLPSSSSSSSVVGRAGGAQPAAKLMQRRGMAGGGDPHGPAKVNFWEDPMSPGKWKEEHFVIISLTGWGLLIYLGMKSFSGPKDKKTEEKVAEGSH